MTLLQNLYAQMPDEKLKHLLLNERESLTAEAITTAKAELLKRKIDLSELESAKEIEKQQKNSYEIFKKEKGSEQVLKMINIIIQSKIEEKENTFIIAELKEQGASDEIISSLFADAKQSCENTIDKTRSDLFYGGILAVASTAVAVLIERMTKGTLSVFPFGALFLGLLKFSRGLINYPMQKKLKATLKQF